MVLVTSSGDDDGRVVVVIVLVDRKLFCTFCSCLLLMMDLSVQESGFVCVGIFTSGCDLNEPETTYLP